MTRKSWGPRCGSRSVGQYQGGWLWACITMSTTRLIPASGILLGPGRRAVLVPLRSELGTTADVLGGEWGGWGVVTAGRGWWQTFSRGPCYSHMWPACLERHGMGKTVSGELRWPRLQVPPGRSRASEKKDSECQSGGTWKGHLQGIPSRKPLANRGPQFLW